MIAMHKNTRLFSVLLLLIGFLASNPVIGMCIPMLSDYLTESHTQMTSGCCDSNEESSTQSQAPGEVLDPHGCECCGCGLQSDESTLPIEKSDYAVVGTQVVELIASWKTSGTVAVASLLPDSAMWDNLPSRLQSPGSEACSQLHSPPLFILHQVLLN